MKIKMDLTARRPRLAFLAALALLLGGTAIVLPFADSAFAVTKRDCQNKRNACYDNCRKGYEGKDTTGDKQLSCAANICDNGVYRRCMGSIGVNLPMVQGDKGPSPPKPGKPIDSNVQDGAAAQ